MLLCSEELAENGNNLNKIEHLCVCMFRENGARRGHEFLNLVVPRRITQCVSHWLKIIFLFIAISFDLDEPHRILYEGVDQKVD